MQFEWWQILLGAYVVLQSLDKIATVAEHLGVLPARMVRWLQGRWLRRLEDDARTRALDSLLSNGITTKLDAAVRQGVDTAQLVARHINEAEEDRRLAAADRQMLRILYTHVLGPVDQTPPDR